MDSRLIIGRLVSLSCNFTLATEPVSLFLIDLQPAALCTFKLFNYLSSSPSSILRHPISNSPSHSPPLIIPLFLTPLSRLHITPRIYSACRLRNVALTSTQTPSRRYAPSRPLRPRPPRSPRRLARQHPLPSTPGSRQRTRRRPSPLIPHHRIPASTPRHQPHKHTPSPISHPHL